MGVTIEKTRPGTELHMGAILRQALETRGIRYRVDGAYLVAMAGDSETPRAWITAYGCNGEIGYDVSRAVHMGTTAAVVTEDGTRYIYDGLSEIHRPVPCAWACADAVGIFLGVQSAPLVMPDPFA